MKIGWLKIILPAFFILFGAQSFAAEEALKNVGFLPSNIWYSKDPFFAGDKIRVYTALFNGSDGDLEGSVEFYDNSAPIGKSVFSLAGGGRLRDVWIDWTATNGNHVISAKIINPKISAPGEEPRPILIANAETGTNERVVDFDINKNGVADSREIVKNAISTGESVVLSKVSEVVKKAEETLPIKPVVEAVKSTAETIDDFRKTQKEKVSSLAATVEKELRGTDGNMQTISSAATTSKPDIKEKDMSERGSSGFGKAAEKPFKYVYLFLLSILEYVLKIRIIFYGLILTVAYFGGRFVYRKIFS